jgi:RNA polymerase sigma-70 factor (ECF subfamily)
LNEEIEAMRWEEIVRDHGPAAYQTAWRILRHAEDCEDVLQNVFMEAHKLFVDGTVTHWRTFLSRLVTYRALDALRRRKATFSLENVTLADPSGDPEDIAIRVEEAARVRAIVAELPKRQAAVFCLAHFEELSNKEIANTLEISTGAVAMALHKGRGNLRSVLLDQLKEQNR